MTQFVLSHVSFIITFLHLLFGLTKGLVGLLGGGNYRDQNTLICLFNASSVGL